MEGKDAVNGGALGRSSFPPGFVFGTATSAYQCEGAAQEGGRGPSIWDTFSHTPGKIWDGSNGDLGVDQYHRYKEDVKFMKDMGVDAYRFSISWSRIFPKGKGEMNEEGVAYYNNLINELINNGIKAYATLFHWDTPQSLEDEYGGFLSPSIVGDFAAYAEACFLLFGDRVKHWITLNEPYMICMLGYDCRIHAPGHGSGNSATEPYIVGHNMLLAHAAALEIYRTKYQLEQKGCIGIALVCNWSLPYSTSVDDQKAVQRVIDFTLGWFMEPLVSGEYPSTMRDLLGARLPKFSEQQSCQLKGSFDFIGVNYYTTKYATHNSEPTNQKSELLQDCQAYLTSERNGVPIGLKASFWLYVYAPGIKDLLMYIKERYGNPPILITENGVNDFPNESLPLKEALNDTWRVDFCSEHLLHLLQAIREGSDVRGYFAWSLMDNFEWHCGYKPRFGLHYVDYEDNMKRYPKASAYWYKKFLLQ
eukprot:Gb_06862 [translate_table: standard]